MASNHAHLLSNIEAFKNVLSTFAERRRQNEQVSIPNVVLKTLEKAFKIFLHDLKAQERIPELLALLRDYEVLFPDDAETWFTHALLILEGGGDSRLPEVTDLFTKFGLGGNDRENHSNFAVERWHYRMLNDGRRNDAFRQAIRFRLNEGYKAVLDIGSGTGIFGLYAANAGATSVHAVEVNPIMASLSKVIIRYNQESRATDNKETEITVLPKLSTNISTSDMLNRAANLLVTETFDAGLLGEHVIEIIDHAWRNLLTPDAKVIPQGAELFACPVDSTYIEKKFCGASDETRRGFVRIGDSGVIWSDEPYTSEKLETMHGSLTFLADPVKFSSIDFGNPRKVKELYDRKEASLDTIKCTFQCTQAGSLSCIAFWFKLHLCPGVELSTAHDSGSCWEQAVFPLSKPLKVTPSDQIIAEFWVGRHVQLMDCTLQDRMSRTLDDGFQDMEDAIVIPSPMMTQLNYFRRTNIDTKIAQGMVQAGANKPLKILDGTLTGLLGLSFIHLSDAHSLTLYLPNNTKLEEYHIAPKCKFVIDAAMRNKVQDRIDCVTNDEALEEYDLILFDPVLTTGSLRRDLRPLVRQLQSKLSEDSGRFAPSRLTVRCKLIECPELITYSKMANNDPVHGLDIAQFINVFSVSQYEDLSLCRSNSCRDLSDDVEVDQLDFLDLSSRSKEFNVSVKAEGTIHGILYWFVLDYGAGITVSTLPDCRSDECATYQWNQVVAVIDETDVQVNDAVSVCFDFDGSEIKLQKVPLDSVDR